MKEFILRARKAKTNSDLRINELPREGKMDIVCATISNALWLSGDVRRDTAVHAVLEGPSNGPKTISFFGAGIRGLCSDERSIAAYIAAALQKGAFLNKNEQIKARAGITIAKKSFEKLVWEKHQEYKHVFFLDRGGRDIRKFPLPNDFVAILGSEEGLPPKADKLLKDIGAQRISLGPKMLFASHCPIIIHNEIDRRGKI